MHQINLDGALTSRFHYNGLGRKTFQAAMHLSHADTLRLIQQKEHLLGLPEHPKTWLNRVYYYTKGGEVEKTQDMLRGINAYRYDAAGNLRSREIRRSPVALQNEDFSYDAPGNISLSAFNFREAPGNRLSGFGHLEFRYDSWGNLSHKGYGNQGNDAFQRFQYDCENRLIHAKTWKGPWLLREGRYHYDCLGRRIAKNVTLHDRDEPETERTAFVWQGLRMLMEHRRELHSLYVYEPDSYAPLARIDTDPLQPERRAQRYYFHTDQLGTPLDMTDESGQFVWRGFYKAWGRVEAKTPTQLEQNLRLQGQYYDAETYLHYNTFRYYDPGVGRFTTQDPIGLAGGVNLYRYGRNPTGTIDPWGWCSTKLGNNMGARRFDGMANHHLIPEEIMKSPAYKNMFKRLRNIGWDGDGASNGKFLPGSRNLSKAMGAPGHWSNHPQYTEVVKNKLSWINSNQGRLSDTQLILGIRDLQGWANAGLENGKFITDKITGKLM